MDINSLIAQYGYAALVVGSLAEGETITLLGALPHIRDYSSSPSWSWPWP